MNYEEFKRKYKREMQKRLANDFHGYTLEEVNLPCLNQTLEGIELKSDGSDERYDFDIAVPYKKIFGLYQISGNFEEFMEGQIASFKRVMEITEKSRVRTYDKHELRERIVMNLVNTERNKHLLNGIPHFEVFDLSVIFKCWLPHDEDMFYRSTAIVNNDFMESVGFTNVEELRQIALKNMEKLMKTVTVNIKEIIEPETAVETIEGPETFILTNETSDHGAIAMLDEKALANIADRVGADLYIIPSSIHEVLVMPVLPQINSNEVKAMIKEVNMTVVMPEEILSYSLYHYSRKTKQLSIVK